MKKDIGPEPNGAPQLIDDGVIPSLVDILVDAAHAHGIVAITLAAYDPVRGADGAWVARNRCVAKLRMGTPFARLLHAALGQAIASAEQGEPGAPQTLGQSLN